MSGAARGRERAAGLVCGSTSPLPARPSLTTPAHRLPAPAAERRRRHLAVVERSDLRGVFQAGAGPAAAATFPATLPLAAALFTATLQLTLVCERWPPAGLGRLSSGSAALALTWAIGAGAYLLLVDHDAVPAAERAAEGLRDPGGPVAAADFGSALAAVGVWQGVFFIALRGRPVNALARRAPRLLVGNVLVIVPGAVTYLVLRELAGWRPSAPPAAA